MNNYYDLFKKFVKKEEVEFYYQNAYVEDVEIEKFGLTKASNLEKENLSIRVFVNGRMGFEIVKKIDEENILEAIENAKKKAKLMTTPKIEGFGDKKTNVKIKFDKSLEKVKINEKIDEVKKEIKKEKHFMSYSGGFAKQNNYELYMNPYLERETTTSKLGLYVGINTKDKKPSDGYHGRNFTKKTDIDIPLVFNQAKENARRLMNPIAGEKGNYTLIFTPEVMANILGLILSATNGKNIATRESYLYGNLNKKIFSKNLTIVEDPHLDYFLGSVAIDDEGIKTKEKAIIKEGVFKKIIYNQEVAAQEKTKTTGNGFKAHISLAPGIGFSNILVKPGDKKIDDVIAQVENGILVYSVMGLHTSNLTTGEFSLVVNQGKEIKNGVFKNTLTNLSFAGNCKEMFKDLFFSKEIKFTGSSCYPFGIMEKVKMI